MDCKASDKDDATVDPRFGKLGKQVCTDTGPLTKQRMLTIDDDIANRAVDFIQRQHKAGKPIFTWVNFTHMHLRTHTKPGSIGQSGRWQSPYHDTMIDHCTWAQRAPRSAGRRADKGRLCRLRSLRPQGRPLHALRRRPVPAPRQERAGQQHLQGALGGSGVYNACGARLAGPQTSFPQCSAALARGPIRAEVRTVGRASDFEGLVSARVTILTNF